mgnify:CR=1 FL=1
MVDYTEGSGKQYHTGVGPGDVGEYVIMKVTKESTGETDYVSGQVDYVAYENDDIFLSINGQLYSIHDLDTVADQKYMDNILTDRGVEHYHEISDGAHNSEFYLAVSISDSLQKLPSIPNVTLGDRYAIEDLYEKMENMNDYEKTFLEKDVFDGINQYYNRLQGLLADDKKSVAEEETASEENSNTDAEEKQQTTESEGV